MSSVRRFWIEFDWTEFDKSQPKPCSAPAELWQGVGVTGFDERDCLTMVAELVPDGVLPPIRSITPDISLADKLPVNPPTLGVSVWRGIWYPPMNLRTGPTWHPRGIDRAINPSSDPICPQRPEICRHRNCAKRSRGL